MLIRKFTSIIPKINQSVQGCPQPLILQYVRDSAIRACERTLIWRYTETPYMLTPGIAEYQYNKPVETDVHSLFEAIMNKVPLARLTLEQAITLYPEWVDLYSGVDPQTMWDNSSSSAVNVGKFDGGAFNAGPTFTVTDAALVDGKEPRAVCQLTPDKYIVLPLPDNLKQYEMRMFYALKPKRDATGMDKAIMDELEDVIVHGTLQELLVMPNVAWTDRELATYHAKQFLSMTTERRARANLANVRGSIAARGYRFA
jgi:hypothetical protein